MAADRDRVTAILTLAEAATAEPELATCPNGCGCRYGTDDADRKDCGCDGPCCMDDAFAVPCAGRIGASCGGDCPTCPSSYAVELHEVAEASPWLARTLLEALDTIDRLEGELADEREKCPMRLIHYGPAEHEHQWVKRGVQGMGLDFLGEKCSVCGAVQALNGGNE